MTHLSCVQNRQTGKAEVFQLSAWDPRHQHGKVPAPGWESRNSIRVLFSRLAAGGTASEILCSTPEPACVTGCCHCSNVVCWIKAASQVSLDGWTFVCSAEDWHVHSSWQIALVSFGSHALLLFPSKQENSAVIFCGMMTGSSADRKAPRTACLSGEDSGKNQPANCAQVSSEQELDGMKSLQPAWDQRLGVKQTEYQGLDYQRGFACSCFEALLHCYCCTRLY